MTRATIAAALCAALLAGCGDDDGPRPAAPATTTAAPETTAAAPTVTMPPAGIDPLDDASDRPVTAPAQNSETALLVAVRAARHEGYDRVVFEFANALPGYDVRYTDGPVRADGSGARIPVEGGHVVVVRMDNALDADLEKPGAPRTYTGPDRIAPGTPEVAELVRVGGFEGVLTWAVGVVDRVDYRVLELADPPRLVVDFRNH